MFDEFVCYNYVIDGSERLLRYNSGTGTESIGNSSLVSSIRNNTDSSEL